MEIITYLLYFFAFYFGSIMGSFLNVFAIELEPSVLKTKTDKNFWGRMNRRSQCNTCGHNLEILDLFPIFSYLFSFGKCRHCGSKFSVRYFLVELFSGLIFLELFYKIFNNNFDFIFFFNYFSLSIIFSSFILIFLFDLKHKIIPNVVIYPTFVFSFLYLYLNHWLTFQSVAYALLAALPFFAIWYLSKGRAMGFADWKLVFLLSLFFMAPTHIYSFVLLAFWYGALYSVPLMWFSRKFGWKSEVPFGPFLILAFFTVYFFQIDVIALTAKIMSWFN